MVRLLFILGILFLALGGVFYYCDAPPPLCTIEQPQRTIASAPGQEQEITFLLTNPTNEVVRIVGLADC